MEEKNYEPSDAELEILQVIWALEPVSVRAVYDRISVEKEVGYTTVLKQIQRLTEKGVLKKTIEGGVQLYVCLIKPGTVKRRLASKILHTAFGGSALDMMQHALGNEKISDSELSALKEWLDARMKK